MQMALLRRERFAAAQLFVSSTWNGGTDWSGTQWSDYAGSDPADDVTTGIETIVKNTGVSPENLRLVCGMEVFSNLRQHPDALHAGFQHRSGNRARCRHTIR